MIFCDSMTATPFCCSARKTISSASARGSFWSFSTVMRSVSTSGMGSTTLPVASTMNGIICSSETFLNARGVGSSGLMTRPRASRSG